MYPLFFSFFPSAFSSLTHKHTKQLFFFVLRTTCLFLFLSLSLSSVIGDAAETVDGPTKAIVIGASAKVMPYVR